MALYTSPTISMGISTYRMGNKAINTAAIYKEPLAVPGSPAFLYCKYER